MNALAEQWNTQLADRLERGAGGPAWLNGLRKAGAEAFGTHGLPHRKVEDWKYTSLRMLEARSHALAGDSADFAAQADYPWPDPLPVDGVKRVR
ncbi:MAG: hypothetical protein R3212_13160, partial [Xanthomonadales bacterium]|nr:hypothetical protein [Xanthomonadales bacterium]